MKKIPSLLLIIVLTFTLMFSFSSCKKKINGKFQDEIGMTTYEFTENGVTLHIMVYDIGVKSFEGTYEIRENKNDEMTITFSFVSDEVESYSGEFEYSEGNDNGAEYITIGFIRYNKIG